MQIGYIVHNLNDAAVERRCRMFDLGGAKVTLAGFLRGETAGEPAAGRGPLILGKSHDAALAARAAATVKQTLFHHALARHLADCDLVVARNLEQLAIARAVVGSRPLVYECLDIHRSLLGASLAARAVQAVEAALLPRCDLLLTSSPAFLRNHFDHRPLNAPALLLENKLLVEPGAPPPAPAPKPAAERPITIGWFGMLRCRETFRFLSDLVGSSAGAIEVLIAGKPSPAELPHLERDVAAIPGMTFTGPYTYADLPALYGRCHFAWTIDWFEQDLNSSWLLPNRLYESIAFGAIPIALASVEVGAWLLDRGAGLVAADADEAGRRLLAMDSRELAGMQDRVRRIDRAEVVCGAPESEALVRRLEALTVR